MNNTNQTDNNVTGTPEGVPDSNTEAAPDISLYDRFRAVYMAAQNYLIQEGPLAAPQDSNTEAAQPIEPIAVIQGLLAMIDGLSLYGNALCQLLALDRKPETEEQHATLRAGVLSAFGTEQRFCRAIEQMHRCEMLKAAGIDPSDDAAVIEFFKTQAQGILFEAPSETAQPATAEQPVV